MKDIRYAGQHAYHLEGTDMYLLEFTNDGKALPSGKHYHQNLHAIVKVKDGKITYFREYWDPYYALSKWDLIRKVKK
ncbi:MAG: hypothetical protein IT497_11040 [Ottowia sp.]|nr:hypothetical protein [Ottowia sp.]